MALVALKSSIEGFNCKSSVGEQAERIEEETIHSRELTSTTVSENTSNSDFRRGALTFFTLSFGRTVDDSSIAHNCRMISDSPSGHRFIVYTDNVNKSACRLCECRQFKLTNCACPNKNIPFCNHCEKIHFGIRLAKTEREFVFLDSDLIILKPTMMDRLYIRSRAHDFLATYRQGIQQEKQKYFTVMNSGFYFLRAMPNVNYSEMISFYMKNRYNSDQDVLSELVFKYYDNWDVLSLQWHCRLLVKMGLDIPFDRCYTMHTRVERNVMLRALNFTLLTVT